MSDRLEEIRARITEGAWYYEDGTQLLAWLDEARAENVKAQVIVRCLLTLINTDRVWRASGFAKDARDWLARFDTGKENER